MSEPNEHESAARELNAAVARIRVRGMSIPVDRWLMIAGGILVLVGIPAIILGWYGASHTPYVFEQIPYLISGGILGMALSIIGAFFYFAYWLTRQVQETRTIADRTETLVERLEGLIVPNGRAAASPSSARSFYATARGTMFHRPECAVVKGRKDVRIVTPTEPGMQPCAICDPLEADAAARA